MTCEQLDCWGFLDTQVFLTKLHRNISIQRPTVMYIVDSASLRLNEHLDVWCMCATSVHNQNTIEIHRCLMYTLKSAFSWLNNFYR